MIDPKPTEEPCPELDASPGSLILETPEVDAELDTPSNLITEGVTEAIPAWLGRKLESEREELKRHLMEIIKAECCTPDYIPEWEAKARRLCGAVVKLTHPERTTKIP